ncbi:MAG: hypothetical protein IH973_12070, partial [Myxococcales bacterium]|nr:hypothetical protein [Myxococcales bacterium]
MDVLGAIAEGLTDGEFQTFPVPMADAPIQPVAPSGTELEAQEPETGILGTIERRTADKAFMEALDKLTVQGRHVSHNRNTPIYAPRVMVSMPSTKGFNRGQLEAAM